MLADFFLVRRAGLSLNQTGSRRMFHTKVCACVLHDYCTYEITGPSNVPPRGRQKGSKGQGMVDKGSEKGSKGQDGGHFQTLYSKTTGFFLSFFPSSSFPQTTSIRRRRQKSEINTKSRTKKSVDVVKIGKNR